MFARDGEDPASWALLESGATRDHSREFRMLNGEGHTETPLANLPFEVRDIDGRKANKDQRDWRMGVHVCRITAFSSIWLASCWTP